MCCFYCRQYCRRIWRQLEKDFCHYLDISIKSVYESVSHLYIAKQQGYINEEQLAKLYEDADKLSRKIRSFKASLLRNA